MNSAILLSSWDKVSREELRRLLRNHTPDESVEILKREIRLGMPDAKEVERMTVSAAAQCMKTVVYGNDNYPDILINIPDPPVVLFYRGNLEGFLTMPAIAVIGSRRCTAYGRKVARTLALQGADILCHPANLVLSYCQRTMLSRCTENLLFAVKRRMNAYFVAFD